MADLVVTGWSGFLGWHVRVLARALGLAAPLLVDRDDIASPDRLADAATAVELPDADVCLIRQVFQHLSNDQIGAILRRCRKYSAVVVTEHWPAPAVATRPNVDKPHGPDTRLDSGSWVDLGAPPFGCGNLTEILRVEVDRPLYADGETLRTFLWRPHA
jgi:hypothetical protein